MIKSITFAVASLVLGGAAQAASFNNTDGLTNLVPSFTLETFNHAGVADNTLAGNLFAGLTFGADIYTSESFGNAFDNFDGTALTNFQPCCAATTSFSFAAPVKAAAFAFVTNAGTSTFIAKLHGNVVESFTTATDLYNANNYYGFSGITFDSIEIQAGGVNNAYALDNLQIAAVPEPETYALMLAGLGLLGVAARRKTAK